MKLIVADGVVITLKRCCVAGHAGENPLSLDSFGWDRSQPDGLNRRCRECHRAGVLRWRRANPDRDQARRIRSYRAAKAAGRAA